MALPPVSSFPPTVIVCSPRTTFSKSSYFKPDNTTAGPGCALVPTKRGFGNGSASCI